MKPSRLNRLAGMLLVASSVLITTACKPDQPQAATEEHDHSKHSHTPLEITSLDSEVDVPQLQVMAEADPMGGWNVQIDTRHFRFTPEHVNGENVAGEGHAHIYVDGFKFARVYSDWYHLKALTPGKHTIKVSLNANDHSAWSHEGQLIESSVEIVQTK